MYCDNEARILVILCLIYNPSLIHWMVKKEGYDMNIKITAQSKQSIKKWGGAEGWIIQLGLDLVSKCLAIIMEIETSSDFWYLSISDGGSLGIIQTPFYVGEPIRWCI